jgi:hypothetical protein
MYGIYPEAPRACAVSERDTVQEVPWNATGMIDWNLVDELDPVAIRRDKDVGALQPLITIFHKALITSDDRTIMGHPLTPKLLQLLQLIIDYLLFCQTRLDKNLRRKTSDLKKLKNVLRQKHKENQHLTKVNLETLNEFRRQAKVIEELRQSYETCPCCGKRFQSGVFLDNHFYAKHPELSSAWREIRGQANVSPSQDIKDLIVELQELRKETSLGRKAQEQARLRADRTDDPESPVIDLGPPKPIRNLSASHPNVNTRNPFAVIPHPAQNDPLEFVDQEERFRALQSATRFLNRDDGQRSRQIDPESLEQIVARVAQTLCDDLAAVKASEMKPIAQTIEVVKVERKHEAKVVKSRRRRRKSPRNRIELSEEVPVEQVDEEEPKIEESQRNNEESEVKGQEVEDEGENEEAKDVFVVESQLDPFMLPSSIAEGDLGDTASSDAVKSVERGFQINNSELSALLAGLDSTSTPKKEEPPRQKAVKRSPPRLIDLSRLMPKLDAKSDEEVHLEKVDQLIEKYDANEDTGKLFESSQTFYEEGTRGVVVRQTDLSVLNDRDEDELNLVEEASLQKQAPLRLLSLPATGQVHEGGFPRMLRLGAADPD